MGRLYQRRIESLQLGQRGQIALGSQTEKNKRQPIGRFSKTTIAATDLWPTMPHRNGVWSTSLKTQIYLARAITSIKPQRSQGTFQWATRPLSEHIWTSIPWPIYSLHRPRDAAWTTQVICSPVRTCLKSASGAHLKAKGKSLLPNRARAQNHKLST